MNTGPRTQDAFILGSQSTTEHDASHSALFYLFQEVSKLASPIHASFLDANSPSTWLNETSRQVPLIVKKEEGDAHPFQISNSSCQHGLSCMSPYNQMEMVKKENHIGKVTSLVEPCPERDSPWKVLSLINLQCERLLHHSDVEELDQGSVSSASKLSQSIDQASTATANVTDQGDAGDCISVECTTKPSVPICERQEIQTCVSPVESGGAGSYKLECCVKDSKVGCCVQSLAAEKTDTVTPDLAEENVTASSQPQHRDKREDKTSVNRQSEWNQECNQCFSSKQDTQNVPVFENALSQTHISNASLYTQLTSDSNEDAIVALSKPALTLDHNANIALTAEPPCSSQVRPMSPVLPPLQSSSLLFSTTEKCHSLSEQGDRITASKPECTHAPIEEKSPAVAQLQFSSCNGQSNPSPSATSTSTPEPGPVQKQEIALSSTQQWRTKTPRKQPHPSRSADIQDADFQGVTFRMDTELDDSKEQYRLLITSKYSKELCKSVRKPRQRTRTTQKTLKTSSSDEESDPTNCVSKGKVCASCCTRKTPMWRDAEDGTPLCNACGIRYKKYRVRCVNCWHIPRKEGNSNSCCLKCGNFVRLTSAQRKHTT